MGFGRCWSENSYSLCAIRYGIGYGFRGNYGSVNLKNSVYLRSNLRNDDVIFPKIRGLV